MIVGTHVLQIVFDAREFIETAFLEGLNGRLTVSVKLGLQLGKPAVPGNFDEFIDENLDQSNTTVIRMRERTDHADVPFPPAWTLMQSGMTNDLPIREGQQREILLVVELLLPFVEHRAVRVAVLDEETIRLRHSEVELLKGLLIIQHERTDKTLDAIAKKMANRKLFEGIFNHKSPTPEHVPCQSADATLRQTAAFNQRAGPDHDPELTDERQRSLFAP